MRPDILTKIQGLLDQPTMTESQVAHLLFLTRILIDDVPTADRRKFALLKFYCDWSLHRETARSSEGVGLIIQLHFIVGDHTAKSDNSDFIADVTSALSLEYVRSKLDALLREAGHPSRGSTNGSGTESSATIAEIISQCPVMLPSEESRLPADIRRQLEVIREHPIKGKWLVTALSIPKMPSTTLCPESPGDQLTFCVLLTLNDSTKIVVPIKKS